MAMNNLREKIKNGAIKWKLNLMVKVAIFLMCVLGIGALIGAWELNAQTKEVHSWMTANNIIAELDGKVWEGVLYRNAFKTAASDSA